MLTSFLYPLRAQKPASWIFNLRKSLAKISCFFSSSPVSLSPASILPPPFPSALPLRQSFTGAHKGLSVSSGLCPLETASALLLHQLRPLQSRWLGQINRTVALSLCKGDSLSRYFSIAENWNFVCLNHYKYSAFSSHCLLQHITALHCNPDRQHWIHRSSGLISITHIDIQKCS